MALIFGTDNNDLYLYGNSEDDSIYGFSGNDRLFGRRGHDRLDGGSGNDILVGGAGSDTFIGGEGTDHFMIIPGDGDILGDFNSDKDYLWYYTPGTSPIPGTPDPVDSPSNYTILSSPGI